MERLPDRTPDGVPVESATPAVNFQLDDAALAHVRTKLVERIGSGSCRECGGRCEVSPAYVSVIIGPGPGQAVLGPQGQPAMAGFLMWSCHDCGYTRFFEASKIVPLLPTRLVQPLRDPNAPKLVLS